MAHHLSDAVRDAMNDAYESSIGASPLLRVYAGSVPATTSASLGGATLLSQMTLPSNWMNASSAGVKTKLGTWEQLSATATGTGAFFRIYDSSGTTCHHQGTVGTAGADMIVSTTSFVAGYKVTVNTFTLTAPNA